MTVTVERELVSQAEEEDMEALLGTYVTSFPLLLTLHCADFCSKSKLLMSAVLKLTSCHDFIMSWRELTS